MRVLFEGGDYSTVVSNLRNTVIVFACPTSIQTNYFG